MRRCVTNGFFLTYFSLFLSLEVIFLRSIGHFSVIILLANTSKMQSLSSSNCFLIEKKVCVQPCEGQWTLQ